MIQMISNDVILVITYLPKAYTLRWMKNWSTFLQFAA